MDTRPRIYCGGPDPVLLPFLLCRAQRRKVLDLRFDLLNVCLLAIIICLPVFKIGQHPTLCSRHLGPELPVLVGIDRTIGGKMVAEDPGAFSLLLANTLLRFGGLPRLRLSFHCDLLLLCRHLLVAVIISAF